MKKKKQKKKVKFNSIENDLSFNRDIDISISSEHSEEFNQDIIYDQANQDGLDVINDDNDFDKKD